MLLVKLSLSVMCWNQNSTIYHAIKMRLLRREERKRRIVVSICVLTECLKSLVYPKLGLTLYKAKSY